MWVRAPTLLLMNAVAALHPSLLHILKDASVLTSQATCLDCAKAIFHDTCLDFVDDVVVAVRTKKRMFFERALPHSVPALGTFQFVPPNRLSGVCFHFQPHFVKHSDVSTLFALIHGCSSFNCITICALKRIIADLSTSDIKLILSSMLANNKFLSSVFVILNF